MQYEVFPIQASTEHPVKGAIAETVEFVGDAIRAKYVNAHNWGGRIVAGYTMRCEPYEGVHKLDPGLSEPSDFLFLVMELPDDWEQRRARQRELEERQE